ncbi:hypothetical protein HGA88_05135 [Candidatus Roizmanbacteria bacterium]|nr:hypothetical protein [Candidatus Roizmanbacteria bacterium]
MRNTPVTAWRKQKITAPHIGKQGRILLWTLIRVPSAFFIDQAPYPVVIAEMEDGTREVGQLVDWKQEDLVKNRIVQMVLRKLHSTDKDDIIHYVIKFRPV